MATLAIILQKQVGFFQFLVVLAFAKGLFIFLCCDLLPNILAKGFIEYSAHLPRYISTSNEQVLQIA